MKIGLDKEPVVVVNAVRLIILAGITFGLEVTPIQLVSTMTALEAVLTIFTRDQVTPVK